MSRSKIKEEYVRVAVQLPKALGEYVKQQGDARQMSYSSVVLELLSGVEDLRADSDALLSLHGMASRIAYCSDPSEVIEAATQMATVILQRSVRKPSTQVAGAPDMITALAQAGKKALAAADEPEKQRRGGATRAGSK